MQQRIKDLWLRARTERKFTFIAFGIGAAILFLVFSAGNPRLAKNTKGKQKTTEQSGGLARQEAYDDIITRFDKNLTDLADQVKQARLEAEEQKKQLTDQRERTAQIFSQIINKLAASQQGAPGANVPGASNISAGAPRPVDVPADGTTGLTNDDSLSNQELDSFGLDQRQVAPPAPPPEQRVSFVGAGDSVRVKLLAGVNAPTDGTPYPVVFKLISDVYGPDGSALPLGEARLIAAAQGSLTDSRALFRMTSINIRLPDGRRKVLKADGWIVGEDGIRGMSGILIDPIGKAILASGEAGFIQGAGEGIASAQTAVRSNLDTGSQTEYLTGSVYSLGVGRGISQAAGQWSGIIRDRLSALVPTVQVLSGREATAVFAKNLTVSGLYEALEENESGAMTSVD